MGLNIKSTKAEAAIRELAALTGETLTQAVERAALERLERAKQKKKRRSLEEALAALRPIQAMLRASRIDPSDKRTARQLIDELYDEHGLPR